jgi:hypothetical protein
MLPRTLRLCSAFSAFQDFELEKRKSEIAEVAENSRRVRGEIRRMSSFVLTRDE